MQKKFEKYIVFVKFLKKQIFVYIKPAHSFRLDSFFITFYYKNLFLKLYFVFSLYFKSFFQFYSYLLFFIKINSFIIFQNFNNIITIGFIITLKMVQFFFLLESNCQWLKNLPKLLFAKKFFWNFWILNKCQKCYNIFEWS